jgi:hypothetical protein
MWSLALCNFAVYQNKAKTDGRQGHFVEYQNYIWVSRFRPQTAFALLERAAPVPTFR